MLGRGGLLGNNAQQNAKRDADAQAGIPVSLRPRSGSFLGSGAPAYAPGIVAGGDIEGTAQTAGGGGGSRLPYRVAIP